MQAILVILTATLGAVLPATGCRLAFVVKRAPPDDKSGSFHHPKRPTGSLSPQENNLFDTLTERSSKCKTLESSKSSHPDGIETDTAHRQLLPRQSVTGRSNEEDKQFSLTGRRGLLSSVIITGGNVCGCFRCNAAQTSLDERAYHDKRRNSLMDSFFASSMAT